MMPRPSLNDHQWRCLSWSRHPRLLQPPWILPTPTRHGIQGFESATRYHRYGEGWSVTKCHAHCGEFGRQSVTFVVAQARLSGHCDFLISECFFMCMDGQSAFMSMQNVCVLFLRNKSLWCRKKRQQRGQPRQLRTAATDKKKSNNAALLSVASVNKKNGTKLKFVPFRC